MYRARILVEECGGSRVFLETSISSSAALAAWLSELPGMILPRFGADPAMLDTQPEAVPVVSAEGLGVDAQVWAEGDSPDWADQVPSSINWGADGRAYSSVARPDDDEPELSIGWDGAADE